MSVLILRIIFFMIAIKRISIKSYRIKIDVTILDKYCKHVGNEHEITLEGCVRARDEMLNARENMESRTIAV